MTAIKLHKYPSSGGRTLGKIGTKKTATEAPYWGLHFRAERRSTISMQKMGDIQDVPPVSLETSMDNGKTWAPFIVGETVITLAAGEVVCFRAGPGGTGGDGINKSMCASVNYSYAYNRFTMTGSISAFGDISSILNQYTSVSKLTARLTFYCLFADCDALNSAPDLPAVSLSERCYLAMFKGCTGITAAPQLPAKALAVECYWSMFKSCSSMVSPPELPATELKDGCYEEMFRYCSKLTAAPDLPALTLKRLCYAAMFSGCTSLANAPDLPAKTPLGSCYSRMFEGCRSLISATVGLTSVYGCSGMFRLCAQLNRISVKFTTWVVDATTNWLWGVAKKGEFACPVGLDTSIRDASHVPEGWTVRRI